MEHVFGPSSPVTLVDHRAAEAAGDARVTIEPGGYFEWHAASGVPSFLQITNPGATDPVTVVVSGAPTDVFATHGAVLDGRHTIPAVPATANVSAVADFRGHTVIVFNVSPDPAPAEIAVRPL